MDVPQICFYNAPLKTQILSCDEKNLFKNFCAT